MSKAFRIWIVMVEDQPYAVYMNKGQAENRRAELLHKDSFPTDMGLSVLVVPGWAKDEVQ